MVAKLQALLEQRGFEVQTTHTGLPLEHLTEHASRHGAIYDPDMIARKNGEITHIVEIESSEAGRSVIGAALLADYCIQYHKENGMQRRNPYLVFAILGEQASTKLTGKRLARLEKHFANLQIRLYSEREAAEKLSHLL